jgi:hypothetical protein
MKIKRSPDVPIETWGEKGISDFYVDSISRIDDGGPISHVIFCMRQIDGENPDKRTVLVPCVRLLVPTAELARMARQLANVDTAAMGVRTDDDDAVVTIN